jgi:hypothetical protein
MMAGLILALGAAPAAAQDRPALLPTRDVRVTYHLTFPADQPPQTQVMLYSASARMMRWEVVGRPEVVLTNARDASGLMLDPARRIAATAPPQVAAQSVFGPAVRFTRLRDDFAGGEPCVRWSYALADASVARPGEVREICVNAEGVIRLTTEPRVSRAATEVEFVPQDPALFQVPAGYERLTSEEMQRRPR